MWTSGTYEKIQTKIKFGQTLFIPLQSVLSIVEEQSALAPKSKYKRYRQSLLVLLNLINKKMKASIFRRCINLN